MRYLALMVLAISIARAHEPSEITAKARFHPDRIEIEFTMARETALRLLPNAAASEGFSAVKSQLEAQAPNLALLSARGAALRVKEVFVRLTRDEEVQIQLNFPSTEGPIRLDTALFQRLRSAAYYCILTIYGPAKDEIRYESLRLEEPRCVLRTAN